MARPTISVTAHAGSSSYHSGQQAWHMLAPVSLLLTTALGVNKVVQWTFLIG